MLLNRSGYWREKSDPQGQAAHSLEAIATLLLMLVEREEPEEREEERTCRMNRYNSAVWACSECGRGYMESLLPEVGEYCMGCGAKVVE